MSKTIRIACKGAATVDYRKIKPFQGDLKNLSTENFERLKKAVLRNGFTAPIHIWNKDGELYSLDGHQRCRLLQKLDKDGYKIPKIPIDHIYADSHESAKRILLSHTSQYGTVNRQGLYEYMIENGVRPQEFEAEFHLPEVDMEHFTEEYFTENSSGGGLTDEDDIPEDPPAKTKPGDLYQLGDHRLLCGNATDSKHIEVLMAGQRADMVFTDPPYGVSYEKKCNEIANQSKSRASSKIKSDDLNVNELKEIIQKSFHNIYSILSDKSCYYICSPQGGELGLMMMMMMQEACVPCRHVIIWVKNAPVFSMGRLDYDYKHEPILFGWSPKKTHMKNLKKGQWQSSVWELAKEKNTVHPTMKPIALMENAILNSSKLKSNIFDPFGGSGSTLIACEKTDRRCFMMEIEPKYSDVIIKRWEDYTGKTAKLISPGSKLKKKR